MTKKPRQYLIIILCKTYRVRIITQENIILIFVNVNKKITNKHGSIYEGDIVECFDIVAVQIRITKETKLTKKMIENARVLKMDNSSNTK
ncbi:hypothetical protein [Candidatus Deianiraea vastatrix]|uniref:hypothetical protein n=1 Tax=Candidatus Deianiraea vastatrix TaxID=2163644 RepID=UPI001386F42F|nr:hypothetical protein [Candidatus Deianiraea vastatrix]